MSSEENRALSPRYDGIPLRYEDSKPVMTQAYTHKTIVNIGDTIHQKVIDQLEDDRMKAIEAAKAAVWEEAERIKEEALEKSKQQANVEREKAIKSLKKIHEKEIKEEALRVEGEMQKLTIEQVKTERESGEKRLQAAVAKTKQEGELAKTKAVAETEKEERRVAKEAAEKLARQVAEKEKETARKAAEDKKQALAEQKMKLLREKELAVSEAIRRERKVAADELARVNAAHAQQVDYLEYQIRTHYSNHQQAVQEIARLEDEKKEMEEKNAEIKKEFQNFINKCSGFQEGQADFLLA
ncbi:uncharacterized protein C6orf163-like [Glandiceps talaboti]